MPAGITGRSRFGLLSPPLAAPGDAPAASMSSVITPVMTLGGSNRGGGPATGGFGRCCSFVEGGALTSCVRLSMMIG